MWSSDDCKASAIGEDKLSADACLVRYNSAANPSIASITTDEDFRKAAKFFEDLYACLADSGDSYYDNSLVPYLQLLRPHRIKSVFDAKPYLQKWDRTFNYAEYGDTLEDVAATFDEELDLPLIEKFKCVLHHMGDDLKTCVREANRDHHDGDYELLKARLSTWMAGLHYQDAADLLDEAKERVTTFTLDEDLASYCYIRFYKHATDRDHFTRKNRCLVLFNSLPTEDETGINGYDVDSICMASPYLTNPAWY